MPTINLARALIICENYRRAPEKIARSRANEAARIILDASPARVTPDDAALAHHVLQMLRNDHRR